MSISSTNLPNMSKKMDSIDMFAESVDFIDQFAEYVEKKGFYRHIC